jgi:hypothetical protein
MFETWCPPGQQCAVSSANGYPSTVFFRGSICVRTAALVHACSLCAEGEHGGYRCGYLREGSEKGAEAGVHP